METLEEYFEIEDSYRDLYLKNSNIDDILSSSEFFSLISEDAEIVLSALGVSPSRSGYKYWKDAIFLYICYNKKNVGICKDIYPAIAKKYGKTPMSVERAMRLCFENVMYYISKNENNFIGEYLKSSLLYPHNGEILVKLVNLIVSKNFQKNKKTYFNI
ncbi:MAG: hypothetical protein IKD36_01830 [Clostridia bacterium]|nr:hypothetical protein [Clostridia bacterium]